MAAIFLKLLNLSISASWLVLAVLVLRLVSKRSPKWMNVLLWGIVALRLMLPFSIESALSLIPSAETVNPAVVQFDPAPTITSGVKIIDNAVNPSLSEHFAAAPLASVNPLYVWTEIAGWVWLIGLGAMLLYAFVSYLRLRRRVSVSLPIQDNIYLCDAISSPFILGVVKPRIYLPSGLDEVQRQNVLSHERAHLTRRDHWWKPLGFALLAVYWFNPMLWLAYALLCRDIELACDEQVIRTMDESAVKTYSTVLLACSMPRKAVITCPLAFGEVGVKERVKNALHYKKPAFWVVAASVAVCIVVAVCFLTNPPRALSKVCGDFWDTEAVCTYTEEQPDADARNTTVNGTVRLSEHLALVRIGAARPEKKTAVNPKWSSLYLALPGADGAPAERLTIDFIREYDAPDGTKAAYTLNIGTRDDSKSYKVLSGQDEIEAFLAYLRGDTMSKDFSISGTVFSYGGESWDLAEQSPAITSLLGCDAVGQYVVITGHGGPKNAFYFIFDTEIRRFSNAFVGTHLVWQNDDLSTAVYAYGGNILSIDGRTLAELDLAENEYVYDLVYSQDGTVLTVAIVSNEETERIVRLTLPIQDEIDDLRGDAVTPPEAVHSGAVSDTSHDKILTGAGEGEEQRTPENDAEHTAYSVKIHAMTAEERDALDAQTDPAPAAGTAFLPRSGNGSTSGNICAPFTAKASDIAFVMYSAPGAANYNVRLCVGEPGSGEWASSSVTAAVNSGVRFSGLTIGQSYYMEVSSDTLSSAGCTAFYTMVGGTPK